MPSDKVNVTRCRCGGIPRAGGRSDIARGTPSPERCYSAQLLSVHELSLHELSLHELSLQELSLQELSLQLDSVHDDVVQAPSTATWLAQASPSKVLSLPTPDTNA